MRLTSAISRQKIRSARHNAGVTLIELVVVITITGIIAVVLGKLIVQPIQGFQAMTRRAELVDAAEMALRQTARDIRQALPNSVRIDPTGRVIEILSTLDGARYRVGPGNIGHNHAPSSYRLQIPGTDNNGFNVVGFFRNITVPFVSSAQTPPARLAIYNQGNIAADAYADGDESVPAPASYVITRDDVTRFTIDGDDYLPTPDEHHVTPDPGDNFKFRWDSPYHRVFIVSTPVTYLCDPGAGTIKRYWNYPIRTAQPTNPAAAPLTAGVNALLTKPVTACTFKYTSGTNTRAGIVTLDITVRDNASGEQVRLLHQVHVDNSP